MGSITSSSFDCDGGVPVQEAREKLSEVRMQKMIEV
jgi:hypothetical protein